MEPVGFQASTKKDLAGATGGVLSVSVVFPGPGARGAVFKRRRVSFGASELGLCLLCQTV